MFSLEEEPLEDVLFSIDAYKDLGDIHANDFYLIFSTGENN